MKSREWRSRAKRHEERWWRQLGVRLRPGALDAGVEGSKYLLIANGATLVASIGGIGEAWHMPELRPVFTILVSYFFAGFVAAIVAWMCLAGATARAAQARVARNRHRSRRLSRGVTRWFFLGVLFGGGGIAAIVSAGVAIVALFLRLK